MTYKMPLDELTDRVMKILETTIWSKYPSSLELGIRYHHEMDQLFSETGWTRDEYKNLGGMVLMTPSETKDYEEGMRLLKKSGCEPIDLTENFNDEV